MNLDNLYPWIFIEILGLGSLLFLFSKKDQVKIFWSTVGLVLGFIIFGLGISRLSTAGAINAILTFESQREPMLQSAFDRLHDSLDPFLFCGYIDILLGSILIAVTFMTLHKRT